jgi:Fe-S oxidoreductase
VLCGVLTACTKTRNNRNETTGTTGTKPPQQPERPEQESEKTGTTETKIEHGIPHPRPSDLYFPPDFTNLRYRKFVMASVEDMEKLNETRLFSFQICMKTVQFVY